MTIIFPLDNRQVVRGCSAHKAAGLGCGVDYVANYVPLYAPVSGLVYWFGNAHNEGGYWIGVQDEQGRKWEMAHTSERIVEPGKFVVAGQRIGTTGNSGTITTGPHLHLQVIQGYPHRIDPEPLLANAPFPMAFDTSIIGANGTLARIGVTPLRYGYILRGKGFEFSPTNDILMLLYPFEKFKLIPTIRVTVDEWNSLPKSNGIAF